MTNTTTRDEVVGFVESTDDVFDQAERSPLLYNRLCNEELDWVVEQSEAQLGKASGPDVARHAVDVLTRATEIWGCTAQAVVDAEGNYRFVRVEWPPQTRPV